VGSFDHKLYAFDATSGASSGRHDGQFHSILAAVANRIVYVGSYDDKLYAFNAATGAQLWTATTGSVIEGCPAWRMASSMSAPMTAISTLSTRPAAPALVGNDGQFHLLLAAVANGVVYVAPMTQSLRLRRHQRRLALDGSDGLPGRKLPAVSNGMVYAGPTMAISMPTRSMAQRRPLSRQAQAARALVAAARLESEAGEELIASPKNAVPLAPFRSARRGSAPKRQSAYRLEIN